MSHSEIVQSLLLQLTAGADSLALDAGALRNGVIARRDNKIGDLNQLILRSVRANNITKLPFTQVETLLVQAGNLIDRSLADNMVYRQLSVDQFKTYMKIKEFSELDRIQEDETAANAYKSGKIDGSMQQAADVAVNSARQSVIDYLSQNQDTQVDLASWVAYNSMYPELNVKTEPNAESGSGYLPRDKRGGGRALGHEAAKAYATDQTTYSFELRKREGTADQVASAARLSFHNDRMKYFSKEPDFKSDRRLTAQRLIKEKIESVITPGGALNYGERMGFIEQRSILDFTNAYSRLMAISDGLKFIFNIDAGNLPDLNGDPAKSKPIEDTVKWLRNAADELAKFLLLDQTYTYRFSLADFLQTNDFKFKVQTPVQFDISESSFGGQYHVRIQAISATIREGSFSANTSPYQLRLTAPRNAKTRFKGVAQDQTLAQDFLPPVWIGRAAPSSSPRDPDIVGQVLRNASPIGSWVLELDDRSKGYATTYNLQDIELHIQVAVQA